MSEDDDPRILLLEGLRKTPLTVAHWEHLPAKWEEMDRVLNRLRAFSLPDGGGEPATRFAPLAVESNAVPPIVTGVKTNDE